MSKLSLADYLCATITSHLRDTEAFDVSYNKDMKMIKVTEDDSEFYISVIGMDEIDFSLMDLPGSLREQA